MSILGNIDLLTKIDDIDISKAFRRLAAKLRLQGLCTLFYVDDILITGRSYAECLRNTRIALDVLTKLGFTISQTKSCFNPSRQMEYLGFLVDTESLGVVGVNCRHSQIT